MNEMVSFPKVKDATTEGQLSTIYEPRRSVELQHTAPEMVGSNELNSSSHNFFFLLRGGLLLLL